MKFKEKKDRKSIAIIHDRMVTGGVEKALINMLRFFDYEKFDVTLWLRDERGDMISQVDDRVRIKYWGEYINQEYYSFICNLRNNRHYGCAIRSVVYRWLSRLFNKDYRKSFLYNLKAYFVSEDKIYDIAISYNSFARDALMVSVYAIDARVKIGWIHSECKHNLSDPYFKVFDVLYNKLSYFFCVSDAVKNIFVSKYPHLESKLETMYNLQDIQAIYEQASKNVQEPFDKLTLVTVGRLSPEKGHELIPGVARMLLDKGLVFKWYVIGEGTMRKSIEELINTYSVHDVVILLGNKNNPYPYISNCDIYVQPSYTEGFCVTTFEAKILKKTVVLTDVPGMKEQFQNNEAYFCEPSVESLCDGIVRAIEENGEKNNCYDGIDDNYNYRELNKLYSCIERYF